MMIQRLVAWARASQRHQRLALLAALSPFWMALVTGALAHAPLPLFLGVIGGGLVLIAYRFLAIDFGREAQRRTWEASNEP